MEVVTSGGKFVAEDPTLEQPRYEAGETAVTGPMFGLKMRQPLGVPGDREQRLHEVIASYLEDLEAGRLPDRPGVLARHPDLAADLASFFANQDHLDRLTAPLRDRVGPGEPPAQNHSVGTERTPAVVPF